MPLTFHTTRMSLRLILVLLLTPEDLLILGNSLLLRLLFRVDPKDKRRELRMVMREKRMAV